MVNRIIGSKFNLPDDVLPGGGTMRVEIGTDWTTDADGSLRVDSQTFDVGDDGSLTISLPGDTLYRFSYKSPHGRYISALHFLDGDTTWANIFEAPTVPPLTPSLVTQAIEAAAAAKVAQQAAEAAQVAAEAVGTTNDEVVAGLINNTGSQTQTAADSRYARTASLTGLRVTTAARDGVTDDKAIIQAALTAAGSGTALGPVTVTLPAGTYAVATTLTMPSGVTLAGERGAKIKPTAAMSRVIDFSNATDAAVIGIELDLAGLPTSEGIRLPSTSIRCTVRECVLTTSAALAAGVFPVNIDGAEDARVVDCSFRSVTRGLRIYRAATRARIERNFFRGWGETAIRVLGTSTAATIDLLISGNTIIEPTTTAITRQPLSLQGAAGAMHTRPQIIGNRVVGNQFAHHQTTNPGDPEDGTDLGGTADAISVHYSTDFMVSSNHVYSSGELGMAISMTSQRGIVTGNVIVGSNTNGIGLGASTTTVRDIAAVDNVLVNNGQERGVTNGPRTGTQAGVWVMKMTGGEVRDNCCIDDQGTPTQLAAVYLKDSVGVTIGDNTRRGGTTTLLLPASGGSTDTRFKVAPGPRRLTTADRDLTDATLANDPTLAFAAEANRTYEVRARVSYKSASNTTDLAVKLSLPTGATASWSADGALNTTTTSTASSKNFTRYSEFSTATLGTSTAASDLYADLLITVTIGATAGTVALQLAQSVADAANPTTVRARSWLEERIVA